MIRKCNIFALFKRILDILIAGTAFIFILPMCLPIAVLLKFSGEGEIFYLQERVGYKNNKFKIYKFATMLKDSLNMGTGSITLKNDFRVTRFGKILRKTKINELPQILNILKGDLSIVGPRPVLEQDWKLYPEDIRDKIYDVRPGLTGIGSIVFRDEESLISSVEDENYHDYYENLIAPYKGDLEIWYQKNQSMKHDLILIILTAFVILFPKNRLHEKLFSGLPKRKF